MVNICCCFDCSEIEIELNLVVLDETPRVHVNKLDPTVIIELPSQCEICSQPDAASNDSRVTIAAIIPSIIVVITLAAIVVVSMLYFRRRNTNKRLDLEE